LRELAGGVVPNPYSVGIEVHEHTGPEHGLDGFPPTVTAFVGSATRGPVGHPVPVESFADYEIAFGGHGAGVSLSRAIEQYFVQGGRRALVVRLVNNARPVSLELETVGESLRLQARDPGAGEILRASVDYDGIGDNETQRFNLVVQRLAGPGDQRVVAQESFIGVSSDPANPRYVATVLADSDLLRPPLKVPLDRPVATDSRLASSMPGFVLSAADGCDGQPLSDYDIVGSATDGTGIFALGQCAYFDLLCIPRSERENSVGPTAMLAALRYCRGRGAMLLLDPPRRWGTVREVIEGLASLGLQSEDAVMAFPWLRTGVGEGGASADIPPSAVMAGVIARVDAQEGRWAPPSGASGLLRGGLRPVSRLDASQVLELARSGINGFVAARPGSCGLAAARTLAGREASTVAWRYVAQRRLALAILQALERQTRWAVFEVNDDRLWAQLVSQAELFLGGLHDRGALAGRLPAESFFVKCDEECNGPLDIARGEVVFVVGFATLRPARFSIFEFRHRLDGTRIRPSTLSPYAQYLPAASAS
jgi:hypothetical protein